ncbi:MAG TPA: VWA domain-containing protein [Thermoanaerobaculia bacterium]
MRFYVAVLATLIAVNASAQFSETLEVRVLEIEATVVDRQQRPVEGLTREDFVVTIDGRPAEITNFSFISRGATRDAEASAHAVEMPVPTRLIIVVDDLHLHPESKQRALTALRQYVNETMDAATTATLLTWNGALTTRTTPTSRRDILLSAIAASASEMPRGLAIDAERRQLQQIQQNMGGAAYRQAVEYYAESRTEDVERTLAALRDIIDTAASAIDGRKILLLISEGVPMRPGAEMFASAAGIRALPVDSARFNQSLAFEELARRAQAAGVVFSTLAPQAAAGTHEGGMGNVDFTVDTRLSRDTAHGGVALLARETGGTLVADQNDLAAALRRIDERVSTYYSLAVRLPSGASDPKIEVRVKEQPKLRVHTAQRRGLPSRDEAIATALRTQLTRRNEDNPLDARLVVDVQPRESGCVAALQFLVPSAKLTLLPATEPIRGQLDVWFTVADERDFQTPVRTRGIAITSKHGSVIGYSQPLNIAPGRYVVSTALVDRLSGATTYLQRDVECGG